MPPRGEAHLPFLQVEGGVREEIEVAGVVVVEVGDDDVPDVRRIAAEIGIGRRDIAQDAPPPRRRADLLAKPVSTAIRRPEPLRRSQT